MGLQRIVVEGYGAEEWAIAAAPEVKEAAIKVGLSISKVEVVSHPGQSDEKTTVVYSVG